MIAFNDALMKTTEYTQCKMIFFDKLKIRQLMKRFDKEICKAINIGMNHTTFSIIGTIDYYSKIPYWKFHSHSVNYDKEIIPEGLDITNCKELYYMQNVIHKYIVEHYDVNVDFRLIPNYWEKTAYLKSTITIRWENEVDKLISKYGS